MSPSGTVGTPAPRGWKRILLRLPIALYRLRLGWLLGRRFLLLSHIGRNSGAVRQTVLEIVSHDQGEGIYVVASGWGERSQWLRNVTRRPQVQITVGAKTRDAVARRMSRDGAERALREYAAEHPRAMRGLARFMTGRSYEGSDEDFRVLAEMVPVVELRVSRR